MERFSVFSGPVTALDVDSIRLDERLQRRAVAFDKADVAGIEITLDELDLGAAWSSFERCTFRQRNRRLHKDRSEPPPQGSFAHRPCLYTRCHFIGVRFRIGGFTPGQARFEECTFERCRWESTFSFDADYVRCRFLGRIRTAVFYGTSPESGRANEIVANDFTRADIDNVAWRANFPVALQQWPDGYQPLIDD
jgi:hypothetical protein